MDTAGTLTKAAVALAEQGAKKIFACATHPVLSGPAVDSDYEFPYGSIGGHRYYPLEGQGPDCPKIKVLSVAPLLLFGEAMKEFMTKTRSVLCLFKE